MSPRAAWRLESLGFTRVCDYVPGKADWFAAGLAREGTRASIPRAGDVARGDDVTCRLGDRVGDGAKRSAARPGQPGTRTDQALAVLELSAPVTVDDVKARYIELVKRFHPDTNGGDKTAEERLKLINEAYTTLKNGVGPHG